MKKKVHVLPDDPEREGVQRIVRAASRPEHVGEAAEFFFVFQAEDGIRDFHVTGVQTCALPILPPTHTDEGLRAALVIRRRWPAVAVLVLSQYVEERYASELLAGNTRGVGYLLKDRVADVDAFVDALRRVGNGGTALDPEVVSQLLARSRRHDPLAALTPREREVLQLMAEGRSNAGISAQLVVTEGAVEKHVSSIFTKLDLPPAENDHRRVLAVLRFLEG